MKYSIAGGFFDAAHILMEGFWPCSGKAFQILTEF